MLRPVTLRVLFRLSHRPPPAERLSLRRKIDTRVDHVSRFVERSRRKYSRGWGKYSRGASTGLVIVMEPRILKLDTLTPMCLEVWCDLLFFIKFVSL